MNTGQLASAYERLLTASRTITPDTRLEPWQRGDVDWTLCHVALSDQLLADAARSVLDKTPAAGSELTVDNFPAMDPDAISAMTASTTHADRTSAVARNAADLLALLEHTPQQLTQTPLTLRMHDRTGKHTGNTAMTWGELISLRSDQHIPAHADRLQGYLKHHVGRRP